MGFWGRLWQYPFDASIWGDVATWAGALGTSGAAIAAASFYIHDKRTERKKQALAVSVSVEESGKVPKAGKKIEWDLHLSITNNSDLAISQVRAELELKPFKDTVLIRNGTTLYDCLPQMKGEWENSQVVKSLAFPKFRPDVEAGLTLSQTYKGMKMTPYYKLRVIFVDANSYTWAITVPSVGMVSRRHKLERVKFYKGWWEDAPDMKLTLRQRFYLTQNDMKVRRWIRKNKPKRELR
ncbi:hypothetical protein [Mycolicibacterium neoaurum]|uniref:hypothetical protein n=1 Tax=Mycolicibacterium neoaurum TaxID=1795 RepID=UPI001F4D2601|nr:hypothetical protein [Mycolicibacterium neoaurum]